MVTPPVTCSVAGCGRPGRNGKASKGKYCDTHIPEGILAGSVTSHKRQATSPAPSTASSQVSSGLPEGWKLLEIKKIFGSRCVPMPRFPCLASPRLALPRAHITLSAPAPRDCAHRLCDPNDPQFDDTDRENGLAGVDFAETLEYLVLGKFERKQSDAIGRITMLWLSTADLAESGLDDDAVDAALAAWEAEAARLRVEAVRAARAERQ